MSSLTFELFGDAVGSEYHETIYATDADGNRIGYVSVAHYEGEAAIKMIEVSPECRRQGVATALLF